MWRGEKPSLREASCCRVEVVKGGAGWRRCDLLSTLCDDEAAAFERSLEAHGGGFVGNVELLELLAVDGGEAGEEGLVLGGGKLGGERPIFLGLEGLDLGFAVADEAERHRLHPAGRAGAGQLPPQHRGEGEADEVVERPAGEIGVDQRPVDLARMAHGVEHGFLGHGVEHHALDRDLVQGLLAVQHLIDVPGDGLALAIGVGGEDQLVRPLHRLGDLVQPLRRLGLHVPMHLEVLVRQDRAVLGGQVANVPVGGEHAIARPQIFVHGLGLSRRLNDDNVH